MEDAEHQDNADFDKLRSNLENADKEFNSLNQEIGVKKLKLSDMNSSLTQLEPKFNEAVKSFEEQSKQLESIKQDLDIAKQDTEDKLKDLNDKTSSIENIKEELSAIEVDINSYELSNNESERNKKIEGLRTNIAVLKDLLKNFQVQKVDNEKAKKNLEDTLNDLKNQHSLALAELDALKASQSEKKKSSESDSTSPVPKRNNSDSQTQSNDSERRIAPNNPQSSVNSKDNADSSMHPKVSTPSDVETSLSLIHI